MEVSINTKVVNIDGKKKRKIHVVQKSPTQIIETNAENNNSND